LKEIVEEKVPLVRETSPALPSPTSGVTVATLAGGASVSLIGKVIGRGLNFLGQIILARLLGPEAFGLYAIGWTILRVAQSVIPLGLDNGVIHFSSRYNQSDHAELKGVMTQSIGLAIFSGLFFGLSLFLAAPWMAHEIFRKSSLVFVLRGFAVSLPFVAGLRVVSAATRVSLRMKFSVYAEDVGQTLSNLVLIFIVYLLGGKLIGAVAAGVVSFVFAFGLALFYLRHLFGHVFTFRHKMALSNRELLLFALPTTVTATFGALTVWVDRLLVGHFLSAGETGIYQAASQSSVLFAIILTGFNAIFAPIIAKLYSQGEMKQLNELFRVSTKWGLYLCLPFFVVICFASSQVITMMFGAEYLEGSLPLIVLTIAQLVNVGTGAVGYMLIMTGRQNQWLLISGTSFLLNFFLSWHLIPRLGLIGASLAAGTSIIWLFLLGLFQVKRSLGLWPYDRRYLKGLYATMLTAITVLLFRLVGIQASWLNLFAMLSSAIGIFGVSLLLFGLDKEDRKFISVALTNLRSKLEGPASI
jgi:O-antigen/teichoic acid export membrane protein